MSQNRRRRRPHRDTATAGKPTYGVMGPKPGSLYGSSSGATGKAPVSPVKSPAWTGDPAKPVAPSPTLAGDPALLAAQDVGRNQIGVADTNATFQANQLGLSYGFDAQGGIDVNNPYSRAALLQESFKRAKRGNLNSYAGAGQHYSGAARRAQNESGRDYNMGYDQLVKGYQGGLTQIKLDQLKAYAEAQGGVGSAAYTALLNATRGRG